MSFKQTGTYGILSADQERKFSIVVGKDANVEARKMKKGKRCSAFTRDQLVEVMLDIGMKQPDPTMSKADLCDAIQKHMENTGRLVSMYGIVSPDGAFRVTKNIETS